MCVKKLIKYLRLLFLLYFIFIKAVFSQNCDPNVPSFTVNLSGSPDSLWISSNVIRDGNCCGTTNPDKCIEFILTLDNNAQGIIFNVYSGAVPPGALFYQVNCGPETEVGSPLCLMGTGPFVITFCKPGNNENQYSIASIPKPAFPSPIIVNDGCSNGLSVSGLDSSTVTWNSIYPGAQGAYNNYLSCTSGCNNVVTTGQTGMPDYIDYLVCGQPIGGCIGAADVCDTVRVYFNPTLNAQIVPIDPTVCFGQTNTTITANGSGGTTPYNYTWSTGSNSQSVTVGEGTYIVVLGDASGCPPTSDTVVVTSFTSPISANAGADQTLCNQNPVVQLSGAVTAASGGMWSGGAGVFTPDNSALNAVYTPTSSEINNGFVDLTLTSTGNGTCPSISDIVRINFVPFSGVLSVSSNNISCFGFSDGTVSVSVTGTTTPYTYTWSTVPVQSASTATGLSPGTYSVTVSDGRGCTNIASVSLTQPTILSATITSTNVSCNSGNNGTAAVVASGGNGDYTYSWSPNNATSSGVSGLTAGNYTVLIKDVKGCSITKTVTISQPAILNGTLTSVQVSCNNGSNGSIDVSTSGGTPPYTYTWSPNVSSGSTASNLQAGVYTVSIADNRNCTKVLTTTITQPDVLQFTSSQSNVSCNGGNNGTATVTVSGGTTPYTYTWSSPVTSSSNSATNLPAGNYTVVINDSKLCNQQASFTITEPLQLTTSTVQVKNISCFNSNDGAIQLNTLGGTPTYEYNWTPNVSTTNVANGLPDGTYTILITDQQNCTNNVTVSLTSPSELLVAETHSNASCFQVNDGVISISTNGGTAPYTYSWNVSGIGNQSGYTSLPAGNYSVLVTDSHNCAKIINATISQPDSLSITHIANSSFCGQANGDVILNVSGGALPYTYSWVNQASTSNSLTGVVAGNYQAIVTDANNCSTTEYVLINDIAGPNIAIAAVQDVSCFGGNDGNATVSVSSGTPPFTYNWNTVPPQTAPTAVGLQAGIYAVSVIDSNGCTTTAYTTPPISQPDSLTFDFVSYPAQCAGSSTGAIIISPSGGTPGYSVNWAAPLVTADSIGSLPAGSYTFTILDTNGCSKTASVTVNQPSALNSNLLAFSDVSCLGGSDGTASVSASGGVQPYSYTWLPSGGNGSGTVGLSAGSYQVIVTDDNLCADTVSLSISQPADSINGTVSTTDVSCNGDNSGAAIVSGSGGNGNYTYTWNPSLTMGNTVSGLTAGNYSVLIFDEKGCSFNIPYTINQPLPLAVNAVNSPSTCGFSNGSITCQATGGNGDYSYSWAPGNGADSSIYNIASGTYYVTVSDSKNCSLIDTFLVSNIAGPQITGSAVTNTSCNGSANGSAEVTTTAIAYPLSYSWTPPVSTDSVASNLISGTYSIKVTDNNGCIDSTNLTVGQPTILTVNAINTNNVSCNGLADGSAQVTVSGGTPAYSYSWSNGGINSDVFNLDIGSYFINVTDANGCFIQQSFTITQPAELLANTTSNSSTCNGYSDGSASVSTSGGTPPYSYEWSNTESENSSVADSLAAGEYSVIVMDANGCSISVNATIAEPPPVQLQLSGTKIICLGRNAILNAVASSGNGGPYTYSWQPGTTGGTMHIVSPAQTTMYTVFAMDRNGCVSPIDTALITVYSLTSDDITIDLTTPICPGTATTLLAISSGTNTGPLTYSWNNGVGTGPGVFTLIPEEPTTYSVTVATICGTVVTKSASVEFISPPNAILGPDDKTGCPPLAINFTDLSIPVQNDSIVSWYWDFGNGITSTEQNPGMIFPETGTYYVTLQVTTAGGCSDTTSASANPITVYNTPTADFVPDPYEVFIPFGEIKFKNQSQGAITYNWQFNDGTASNLISPTHMFEVVGLYTVELIATNNYGCQDTAAKDVLVSGDIIVPNAFTPNASGPNSNPYDISSLDNDIFHPYANGITEYNFQIFNRWGELIFETNDLTIGWDGYYRDKLCQQGVYVWQINATFNDGRKFSERGDVTLLR